MTIKELKDKCDKWYGNILEVYEVVGEYEFYIEGLNQCLKIKVLKYHNGYYRGSANLRAGGYKDVDHYDSKEMALERALVGFLDNYKNGGKVSEEEDW